jgi:hypothetical protein
VLLGERDHLVGVLHRLLGARHQWRARALRDVARLHLVAERVDRGRRRPDPGEARVDDGLGEGRVLGEEAVAGVHGVGAGARGDVEQLVDDEVGVARGAAVQRVGLVGDPDVQGVAVLVGVDGDAADAGIGAGPGDPDGDLAAVGDQHLAHGGSLVPLRPRSVPGSLGRG